MRETREKNLGGNRSSKKGEVVGVVGRQRKGGKWSRKGGASAKIERGKRRRAPGCAKSRTGDWPTLKKDTGEKGEEGAQ